MPTERHKTPDGVLRRQNEKLIRSRQDAEAERRRYEDLFEFTPNAYLVINANGTIDEANRAAAALLNVSAKYLVGKPIVLFLGGEDQKRFMSQLALVTEAEDSKSWETMIQPRECKPLPAEVTVVRARDHEGKISGYRMLIRDITAHKQMEETLRDRERDFNRAQAVAHTGSWRLNVQRNELAWSPENHRIFGIQPGTPLNYETFLSVVHPDDREHVDREWKAALHGEPYDIEHRIVVGDIVKWVREKAELEFDDKGKLLGGFGTTQDITERRRAEEQAKRQSAVLDAISTLFREAFRSKTEHEVARICLRVAENLTDSVFGFIGEIKEDGTFDCIALSDPGWAECRVADSEQMQAAMSIKIRGYWGKALIEGRSLIINDPANHPDRVGMPEGHPPVTAFLGVPFKRTGKTTGMIALANRPGGYTYANQQDIEDLSLAIIEALNRKKADEALRESEIRFRALSESLEEKVRQQMATLLQAESMAAIGRMISAVAHEIRNPLQSIRLGVDALKKAKGDGKTMSEIAGEIAYGVDMLNTTVSELLDYSRPVKPEFTRVPIAEVVKRACLMTADKIQNIVVHADFEREGMEIWADENGLLRVFMNLIVNAADAMQDGGDLRISARLRNRNGTDFLSVSVSDSGCGIPEDKLANIQDPFFTTKTRGVGLGLSVCKKIVEAHSGTIGVESAPGEGTTVDISLPLVDL